MPNWCSTKIEFTGTTADLADFHDKIVKYTTTELASSGFGKDWLGNVLHGFGFGDRIDAERNRIGLAGSPTKVKNITSVVLTASEAKSIEPTEQGVTELIHELISDHTLG